MAKLTPKQQAFVNEYLIDLNATQAAIRAGYSQKTANRIATENLSKPVIQAEIQKAIKEREKRTEINQDFVLRELFAIANANGVDFVHVVEEPIIVNGSYVMNPDTGELKKHEVVKITPTDKLPKEKQKAISNIKETRNGIEVNTHDKVRALELLGKHLGMFKEKVEVSGHINNPYEGLTTAELKKLIKNG